MLLVTDLLKSSLPKEFLNVLPTVCDKCGSPTEITETLTILRCSNMNCGEKSVHRLVALLQDLDVKNMGESKCRKFLENFEILNPYAIFMYEPSDGTLFEGCSMEFSEAFYDSLDTKRDMLLWEYIKIGNMSGIRDSARKLFAEYDDLEEFYADLEGGGISFIQELLNIKGKKDSSSKTEYFENLDMLDFMDTLRYRSGVIRTYIETEDDFELMVLPKNLRDFVLLVANLDELLERVDEDDVDYVKEEVERVTYLISAQDDGSEDNAVSVRAVKVYNTLMYHKDELFEAIDYVNIKRLDTPVLNICISTSVGKPYKSKKDFISQMNDIYGDKVHLNFLSSVSKDCHFLIWSGDGAPTSKVTKARKHNDKMYELGYDETTFDPFSSDPRVIRIMDGAEFDEYLNDLDV